MYRIPVLRASDNQYFDHWKDVRLGYLEEFQDLRSWPQSDENDVEHGYPHIARAAASYLPGVSGEGGTGDDAWRWMCQHVGGQDRLNDNPKWAIVPRDPAEPARPLVWRLPVVGSENRSEGLERPSTGSRGR
jgi:hypothetical protein